MLFYFSLHELMARCLGLSTKRSRIEIYIDVLHAIKRGTHKPTRIMYRTNLSWKPLMSILESMVEQGLIRVEENGNRTTYWITEKGKNVLNYFTEALNLIEIK